MNNWLASKLARVHVEIKINGQTDKSCWVNPGGEGTPII